MRKNNRLDSDVDLDFLADQTQNYTGAEIKGVVTSATSHAFLDVSSTIETKANGGPASADN